MDQARHFLTFKFDMALHGIPVQTSEGRIQASNRLTPLLAGIQRPTVRSEYMKLYADRIGISEEALLLEVKRYEQSRNPAYGKFGSGFQNSGTKKAISKSGSTSLKRHEPLLTDNIPELRSQLTSRHLVAEKNLLKLALYNSESFSLMMSVLAAKPAFNFDDPVHQEILTGLRSLSTTESEPNIDPSANGFLGTLIEKMNHLYFDKPDVIHTFAELTLTSESFCESIGLSELQGFMFKEKLNILAEQQIALLERCRTLQHLQALKSHASQNEGEQVELTYQFQDRFAETVRQAQGTAPGTI
jgi:hypothetical protein